MEDRELLIKYVETGSEEAFEELVKRHIALVRSSAARRASAAHADDITQAVFMILAKKAPKLCRKVRGSLAGWLYRTTRYAASEVMRSESRRQDRERTSEEERSATSGGMLEDAWDEVKLILDDAVDRLSPMDREAVLLRYFEDACLADVGRAMGTSENAASKRVSRALEKLRKTLMRRGVSIPSVAMAVMLTANAVEAAPTELVSACVSIAATGAGVLSGAGGLALLADGTTKALAVAQAKTVVIAACTAAAITAATVAVTVGVVHSSSGPSVRLMRIRELSMTYEGRSVLADGHTEFQINSGGQTYFRQLRETVCGFSLVAHDEKWGLGTTADPGARTDISELHMRRGDTELTLVKGRSMPNIMYVAVLSEEGHAGGVRAISGEAVVLDLVQYRVVLIDPEERTVTVRRVSDGKEYVIR